MGTHADYDQIDASKVSEEFKMTIKPVGNETGIHHVRHDPRFLPSANLLAVTSFLAVTGLLAQLVAGMPLAGQEARTFRPLRSLGAGSELTASVSLGDVNGDGALDVVVANGRHWPGQNRIYLNDGWATFTLARRLGDEEAGTYAVPLADFDGDGDLDIAVGNDRTRNLVFLNGGTGRFEAGATFGTPSSTRSLTLADLDGDGHTDILVVNRGRQNFIFLGDGSGAFRDGTPFGAGDDSTIDVAAADLDGDGDPDLVLANRDGEHRRCERGVLRRSRGRVRAQPAVRVRRRPELRGPPRGHGSGRGPGHHRRECGRAERGVFQPVRRGRGVRRIPLRVRGLRHLWGGGGGSERRWVS